MDKVAGDSWGRQCAWCSSRAVKQYVGLMAGEELVRYQVCNQCYKDRPNYVRECKENDIAFL